MIRRASKAFTLVELLLVVAVVVLLLAIILPALSHAREAARLTVCRSNHKQIVTALIAYAMDNHDALPNMPWWMIPSITDDVYFFESCSFYSYIQADLSNGWVGFGLLFDSKIVNDPKLFYCPSQQIDLWTYPLGWEDAGKGWHECKDTRVVGYFDRVFGPAGEDPNLRLPTLPHPMALSADILVSFRELWEVQGKPPLPHVNPYVINVSYSDGHVEGVYRGQTEYQRALTVCRLGVYEGAMTGQPDKFAKEAFRSLDDHDLRTLQTEFPLP